MSNAVVVNLTDVRIPAEVNILVRVYDTTGAEALFVLAPVAILANEGLAYIPDIIECGGRGPHDLVTPECGIVMPHAPHLQPRSQAPLDGDADELAAGVTA